MKQSAKLVGAMLFVLAGNQTALAGPAADHWTGCYAGLHAGGLGGGVDNKVTGTSAASYQRDTSFSVPVAGAHAGCNHKAGPLVLGVEGDLSWTPANDHVVAFQFGNQIQFWHHRFDWLASLRGRIGLAAERWHAYATAGMAFANLNLSFESLGDGDLTAKFSRSSTKGWVAGGGIEYALPSDWSMRLEYLYHRFDSRLLHAEGGQFFFRTDEPTFHVLRVGVTRRFGL